MGETVSVSVGLEQAAAAYQENPNPETVTGLWQEFWVAAGKRVGIELTVAEFPGTEESLTEHLRAGDMPIYVPLELASQANRHILGLIWPEMGNYSVEEGNPVTNEEDRSGWRYVEVSIKAPYRRTSEAELHQRLSDQRRVGLTLNEYVIGAQMSNKLTGRYFDEDTWSRLLGSRGDGDVVSAYFGSNGYLGVDPYWSLRDWRGDLGGRSSEGVV